MAALREFERWDMDCVVDKSPTTLPYINNMWHFTADLHLDHTWLAGERGFRDVHSHNEELIRAWNSAVKPEDVVVVLGDIFWTTFNMEFNLRTWATLKGNKIIVKGNHDYWIKKAKLDFKRIYQRKLYGFNIVCCHYPMRVWNGKNNGAIHLHGHSHGAVPPLPNSMDVGVDVAKLMLGELRPFSFKEIIYLTKGIK